MEALNRTEDVAREKKKGHEIGAGVLEEISLIMMDMESLGILIVVGSFLAEWARDPIARLLVLLRRHTGNLMLKGVVQGLQNLGGGGLTPLHVHVTGRSWRRRKYLRVSAPRGRPLYISTQLRRSDLSSRLTA